MRYKNLFILETKYKNNAILIKEKDQLTYFFNSNLQIYLWHHYLGYTSNTKIIQASKLVNRIDFEDISKVTKKPYSSNSESDNNSDNNGNNQSTLINKVISYNIKYIKKLYKVGIKSKYIKIVKLKKMTLIIKKL